MLAHLESGRPLPPDPREAGTTREPAAAFTARLKKIVARYEAQFLKRKEWQVGVESEPPLSVPELAVLEACICADGAQHVSGVMGGGMVCRSWPCFDIRGKKIYFYI